MAPWIVAFSNIFTGLLCIGLALPMACRKVPPNRIYGARFRRSFESSALWYEINAFAGRRLIGWSAVLVVIGRIVAASLAPLLLVIPCWQAWRYSLSAAPVRESG